jgi:16S rRNA (cytosine967-C5)-methyltransferase
MDATVLDEASVDKADVVLCDAPCSGLGVIAGKPDIKYHMTETKRQELSALQQQILSTVCHYVKPGGTLLYSTCTVSRVENEDNVSRFLAEHPEFSLDKEEQILPEAGNRDGFFYARMKRVLS